MKEKYMKPDLEITRFEADDVITASSAGNMTQNVNEMIEKDNVGIKDFESSIGK